jgi:hypothetical protein
MRTESRGESERAMSYSPHRIQEQKLKMVVLKDGP